MLLASGAITLYQLALIEAGNVDGLMLGRFRVIGPVSNMPEFAQAFSCKTGDTMVRTPEDRVTIW